LLRRVGRNVLNFRVFEAQRSAKIFPMYSQVLSNEIKTTLFNTFCEKKYFNSLWIKFVFATLHSSSLQFPTFVIPQGRLYFEYLSHRRAGGRKLTADQIWSTWIFKLLARHYDWFIDRSI
jgi:hypothetical protein